MFTFNERDLHRMPTPAKTHLPIKKFIAESNILDEDSTRDNEVSPRLIGLSLIARRMWLCFDFLLQACVARSPRRMPF
jgi:hypothetical protein